MTLLFQLDDDDAIPNSCQRSISWQSGGEVAMFEIQESKTADARIERGIGVGKRVTGGYCLCADSSGDDGGEEDGRVGIM